jgi:hypothetical protein
MEHWSLQWIVLGLYALTYYCKLEIEYCNYHCHQIARCGCLTFAMMPISEALDHVVSQAKQVPKEWKKTIGTCQKFVQMEELNAQTMEAIQWRTS